MSRNIENEIDEIKKQMDEMKSLVTQMLKTPKNSGSQEQFAINQNTEKSTNSTKKLKFADDIKKMKNMHPDESITAIMDRMENTCGENGETGRVMYLGVFASENRQSSWIQESNTDSLLEFIENRTAEKVLNCIGNNDRLNILLALLKKPMSVSMLVEKCGYNSTGQVYHHLKPLIASDLIAEDKHSAKGTYFVQPHRVQGIIMMLAGIGDLVDTKYSKGNWDENSEIHKSATMVDERYLTTTEEEKEIIEKFFSSLDPLVLEKFPPKEKRKIVVLKVIAEQFEKDKKYTEKEVNDILKRIYEEDHVIIRRYLIEYGFMKRKNDCSEYWL